MSDKSDKLDVMAAVLAGSRMIERLLTRTDDGNTPADVGYEAMQKVREETNRIMEENRGLPDEELRAKLKATTMTLPLRELAAMSAIASLGLVTLKASVDFAEQEESSQERKPDVH
jgi:hypothetical protein